LQCDGFRTRTVDLGGGLTVEELAKQLAHASSPEAFSLALADVAERYVPTGTFTCALLLPGVAERPHLFVRSSEFPPDEILEVFPEILLAVERDLGTLQWALGVRHAFDGYARFNRRAIQNSALMQDYWRPFKCDQQLVAPLWFEGAPVGYFHFVRSHREPVFTPEDLRWCEEARRVADRALQGLATLGHGHLSLTLANLSACFPHPAYLFGSDAELRWMSDEGVVRLSLEAARLGGGHLIRGNSALALLSEQVRLAFGSPTQDLERPLKRAKLLRPGECVATRRFSEFGSGSLLVAFVPAMATLRGQEADWATSVRIPGLGAIEARVAQLAADGHTVLNIATRLGVTESTVRTHLHRIYVKLGVHSRAELATLLLRGKL
jgi:DNA-binding CsgD family transcriptional regulator